MHGKSILFVDSLEAMPSKMPFTCVDSTTRMRFPPYGLLVGIVLNLCFIGVASGHPGNTDGSGCHTCRTNCPSWGYNYGEYHCHGGGGGGGTTYDQTPTARITTKYYSRYEVILDGSSSWDDVRISSYAWNVRYGSETVGSSSGESWTFHAKQNGTYEVTLS